ncbi:TPA: polysaccharide deacetylase family protein [Escherichia coli]|nr:polysaccharide deacetylase family protein [Escherichia coli]
MKDLTVVMYHYVRPIERSRYPGIKGLELNDFREQIAYLKKNYNPVTIEEVYASFYENHQLPPNAAILTFDDAYLDHFKYAYPILKKMEFKAVFMLQLKQ